jgi:hypothetical protein
MRTPQFFSFILINKDGVTGYLSFGVHEANAHIIRGACVWCFGFLQEAYAETR